MATVGLYVADLDPGGITRFVDNLGYALTQRGHRIIIIADRLNCGLETGVEVRVMGAHSVAERVCGLKELSRSCSLDAVISNGWFADVISSVAAMGLRRPHVRISVTHTRPHLWGVSRGGWVQRSLKRHLVRWAFDKAEALVAVSHGLAAELNAQQWSKREFRTIYNPVVSPVLKQYLPLRRDLPPAGAPFELVAMGWLLPEKGFDVLLRALPMVRRYVPVNVTIIGSDNPRNPGYAEMLRQLAAELGVAPCVHFVGRLMNPFPTMAQADLFILPSRTEALPTALIEAMALGLPAVACDCAYGTSEILDSGRFGILVPPESPQALANGILSLVRDQTRLLRFRDLAIEGAQRFRSEAAGLAYDNLLQELVGRREKG